MQVSPQATPTFSEPKHKKNPFWPAPVCEPQWRRGREEDLLLPHLWEAEGKGVRGGWDSPCCLWLPQGALYPLAAPLAPAGAVQEGDAHTDLRKQKLRRHQPESPTPPSSRYFSSLPRLPFLGSLPLQILSILQVPTKSASPRKSYRMLLYSEGHSR